MYWYNKSKLVDLYNMSNMWVYRSCGHNTIFEYHKVMGWIHTWYIADLCIQTTTHIKQGMCKWICLWCHICPHTTVWLSIIRSYNMTTWVWYSIRRRWSTTKAISMLSIIWKLFSFYIISVNGFIYIILS